MASISTEASTRSPLTPRDEHFGSAWDRFDLLRYKDVERDAMFAGVMQHHEQLARENAELRAQLRAYALYIGETSRRENVLRNDLRLIQSLMNSNPFIVVLIDGNGSIFNRDFLNDGERGGRKAASIINDAIIQWVPGIGNAPVTFKVVVQIYADLSSLADVCTKAGLVDSSGKVRDFARGMTQHNAHFNFIDVGPGAGQTEVKVTESFKLFLDDWHCRQVVLGCGQNHTYSRLLEQYMNDPKTYERATLLESTPTDNGMSALPLRSTKIQGLFQDMKVDGHRSDLLNGHCMRHDSGKSTPTGNALTPRSLSPIIVSPLSTSGGSFMDLNSLCNPIRLGGTHALSSNMPLSGGRDSSLISSWAKTAAVATPPSQVIAVQGTTHQALVIRRNKKGQRIDEALSYDNSDLPRVKKIKMCNQHYLGIHGCTKAPGKCRHDHSYKPSAAELRTLRAVARETPCKMGTQCDERHCIYGHRCPFPVASEGALRGISCLMGENCRFPREMHAVDTVPVSYIRIGSL